MTLRRSTVATLVLAAGCTAVSGVDDLTFDLVPPAPGVGGGGETTTTVGTGGNAGGASAGGGGQGGIGGSRPPLMAEGPAFLVGATAQGSNSDHDPSVVITADDTVVVAWTDIGTGSPDGQFSGIRYDTFTTGSDCVVCNGIINDTYAGSQLSAGGVALASGGAVYGFQSVLNSSDGHAYFLDSAGAKVGAELDVPSGNWIDTGAPWVGFTGAPAIAAAVWVADDGDGDGVFFASLGPPVESPLPVNITTAGNQTRPAVAFDAAGRGLVVWVDGGTRIAGRLTTSITGFDGGEIDLDASGTAKCAPAVAASDDTFLVVYAEGLCAGDDYPDGGTLTAVRVDAAGQVSDPFPVLTAEANAATAPDVAFDGEHFHVVWTDAVPGDDPLGLFMRRIRVNGTFLDGQPVSVLDPGTPAAECNPSVAAGVDGRIAVSWAECTPGCIRNRSDGPDPGCKVRARTFRL